MQKDKFSNIAYIKVEESAANTLTFTKLETGIAPFEKVAYLINRLEYVFGISAGLFAAESDTLEYGLAASDQFTAVDKANSAIFDYNNAHRLDLGTAGTGIISLQPVVKDYSTLPGSGLLIAPNPLYMWVMGTNAPLAFTVEVRLYYTIHELKADEFWELVEMRRMIGT